MTRDQNLEQRLEQRIEKRTPRSSKLEIELEHRPPFRGAGGLSSNSTAVTLNRFSKRPEASLDYAADVEPDLEAAAENETAFRRGVAHAFNLAGDLVRAGATADDLDTLTDLAMDWRYGARPNVGTPEDLVAEWRRGEHGFTGLDPRALGVVQ